MLLSLNSIIGRLRLKQLVLLIQLEEHRSLHKAAEAMNMTQPAATKALHEIESTIGVALFDRSWRGIEPTFVGSCVIRYARLIYADLSNMHEELASLLLGRGGRVRLGSIMGPVPTLLTETIAHLCERHPSITIEWLVDTSSRLLSQLQQGKLDLVIGRIRPPHDQAPYDYQVLSEEPLSIVAGANHPLTQVRQLELESLMDYPWVLLPRDSPLRELVEREFADHNLPLPFMPVETPSMFATIALLQHTQMISVMPTEVAELFASGQLLSILPVHFKSNITPYGLIARKETSPSPAVQLFLSYCRLDRMSTIVDNQQHTQP